MGRHSSTSTVALSAGRVIKWSLCMVVVVVALAFAGMILAATVLAIMHS